MRKRNSKKTKTICDGNSFYQIFHFSFTFNLIEVIAKTEFEARFGTLNGSDSSTNKSDFCYKSVLINPVYNHSKILGNLEPTEIEDVQE